MTVQNKLYTGDLIHIGASRTVYLVTQFNTKISPDTLRNDSYSVDEMSVIEVAPNADLLGINIKFAKDESDVSKYYFNDGDMRGDGTGLDRSDVKVCGTCTVNKEVKATYKFSDLKWYS